MVDHEIIFQVCAKLLSVSCSLLLLYCQVQVLEATFVHSTTMVRTSDSRGMNLLQCICLISTSLMMFVYK